ncbi:putative Poly(A) RNA polymerase cid14 [Melia azedarach]|uniref:Poly(A) RNA polymerase cid14 n=1 Tax=Melia azedarach TaxID=155640 RepID=A0ACC1YWN0_MELAZ|nr:putative Poly(A) RNA polymerase cid14 [Melia azedarach]
MGEHEGWREPPSGLLLNGLLPNESGSVIRVLDSERWSKAEERTAELIACIQPNPFSEERRNAVADYVQRLIVKCFPCQVFTFGSVPLKTYLPDGDIDLSAFSDNQNLKETWAHQVRDMLENEEKNEHAEFRVKEVQYIQAEVKIIKCLVENIVVDISFNQLGGLCTLCFLEEVDHMINQNHLFKRSIILIKAWCYYESRILGAHHGLISTYALETLVLYIFHVFNNSFAGPLEVLYRFLEFFSKFDWDNFCLSLWGPVPISSLPDVTAEPPRKDGGVLLLSKLFLDACSSTYSVFPAGQENQGQPFVSKHFNVIDPLRINNNLGRSVSKGNFFRIRSAFAFGAKKLARLLDCPKEDLYYEVNQFFMNTWDRHGSGLRPDAPRNDLWGLRLSNPGHQHEPENLRNNSNVGSKRNEISSSHETQVDRPHGSSSSPSQHANTPFESTSRASSVSTVSRTQTQRNYGNLNSTRASDQVRRDNSINQNANNDKGQRSLKPDTMVSDIKGRYLFARTRSSPELTDTYGDISSQGRLNKAPESGKNQISSSKLDSSQRKNLESDILASHDIRSSSDDPSSVRHATTRHSIGAAPDSNSVLNSYSDDLVLGAVGEEYSSVAGTQGMQQEEQDLVNLMASSMAHGFNGQVHIPLNLASGHLPLPLPPSVLASMGYSQRNLGGMVPTNLPFIETASGANMQFPQSLVSSPLTHYFPGIGLTSSPEDSVETGNENFGPMEMNPGEGDHDYWHEQDRASSGGFDLENGNFEMLQSDDKQQSTSAGYNLVPSTRTGGSGSARRSPHKFTKEARGSTREDHLDSFHYLDNRGTELHFDDRSTSSRSVPASHTSSVRSKTNSESSWDGSSVKISKTAKEKRGRKTAPTAAPSTVYGKGKSVSEHSSVQADDDNREWNLLSTVGAEMPDRSIGLQSVAPLHVPGHQMTTSEEAQTSGSDSMFPIAPVLLGPGTFYPTGPPVPFLTMLPVYNFPSETGTSDAPTGHFSGDEGLENSDSGQNFDVSEGLDQSEVSSTSNSMRRSAPVEPLEHKSDILNSDFLSHWQNLQYGRFCQNPRLSPPLIYPSTVMVPPVYLQGRFPWDGPGRPLSGNMNLFTQLMNYGPRLVPVAPLQSASNRPAGVYQRYIDEMPRYRGGTGTYLPNPKVSARDRHSTSTRRGNYSHDRSDHHVEREGNWNVNSKSRASGRSHNRNQAEKSSSRTDRLAASESRADRPWGSQRHETFPPYHSQNGPFHSNSSQSASANMAYGMYPLSTMNPSGVSSNGPSIPPVVMLYPYDHNSAYASPTEQLEFGSLGPVGFSGVNEVSQLSEGSRTSGTFEEQRYQSTSGQQSSLEQPSSHGQRGL